MKNGVEIIFTLKKISVFKRMSLALLVTTISCSLNVLIGDSCNNIFGRNNIIIKIRNCIYKYLNRFKYKCNYLFSRIINNNKFKYYIQYLFSKANDNK